MEHEQKHIAVLGSTTGTGRLALDIVSEQPELFQVEVLTSSSNNELLIEQAIVFKPNVVVVGDDPNYAEVKDILWDHNIKTYAGSAALSEVVQMSDVHLVLNALNGEDSIQPTLASVMAGKAVALAHHDSVVSAGLDLSQLASQRGANIFPLSSANGGLFQCIVGEKHNTIDKVTFTIKDPEDPKNMLNFLLEVLQAKWVFDLKKEQIDLIHHPEACVLSLVHFEDGTIKTIMGGIQDPKSLLRYAMSFPYRLSAQEKYIQPVPFATMNFSPLDGKASSLVEKFKNCLNPTSSIVLGKKLLGAKARADDDSLSWEQLTFLLTP